MNDLTPYRPFIFLFIIIVLSILQRIIPFYKNKDNKRYIVNALIFFTSILASKFFYVLIGTKILELPRVFQGISQFSIIPQALIGIIVFDLLLYLQHRLFHKYHFLWKLHRIHHSDKEMDFTTGIRFHPLEIFLSLIYKYFFLYILNPSVEVFILYEILINSFSLFNHSNIRIPLRLENILRLIVVTPNMHFPHHDESNHLMNSNFGNILSLWDRLFKTYTNELPTNFGIKTFDDTKSKDILKLILLR